MSDRELSPFFVAAARALLLGAIAGCGGASSAYQESRFAEPEREDPAELADEQAELERALSEELARPEADCGAACNLAHRICDLSSRICGIAQRHPSDEELSGRCGDAGGRCDSARERVAERCTCE